MVALAKKNDSSNRLAVLDGWRGISILLVLATHMLPLGLPSWKTSPEAGNIMNETAGNLGMSLFFLLSGFLITSGLFRQGNTANFLIRRLFRILPLSLLYLILVLLYFGSNASSWLAHTSFAVNYFPKYFLTETLHFWSLCTELHFYFFIALLFGIFGKKGLYFLPAFLVLITLNNALNTLVSTDYMLSHVRVAEILAGSLLAIIHFDERAMRLRHVLAAIPLPLLMMVLFVTCFNGFTNLYWARPFAAMALIGHTLYSSKSSFALAILSSRFLFVIAEISYALYVIHPITIAGWLGEGHGLEKYLKRPISFALSFGLAYVSTHYFEKYWINLGKKLTLTLGSLAKKHPVPVNAIPAD